MDPGVLKAVQSRDGAQMCIKTFFELLLAANVEKLELRKDLSLHKLQISQCRAQLQELEQVAEAKQNMQAQAMRDL